MAVNGIDIVNYLKQFIGTPYVWGGQNPGGFDCSGLLVYGFKKFGIQLNRTTYEQIGQGDAIKATGLRAGDLVFFETNGKMSGPDHVGIYMGDGKMLHAPRPGKSVEISDMSSYWMDRFTGGRRIAGVVTPGASEDDAGGEEVQKKLTPEELAAEYGWSYAFLNSNPELKKLFKQTVEGGWTEGKFNAELKNTSWWKKTSESARQAEVMAKTDPATYQAMIEANSIKLQQLAAEVGASIPQDKFKKLVEQVVRTGMQEDEIRYMLGGYIQFTKNGTLRGEAGMHEYNIKQYAHEMGVNLSDEAVKNQAARIIAKVATFQDFQEEVKLQAISAFPGYEEQIMGGMSMKDIASPYQQVMAQELELPEASLGINDPMIRRALNGLSAEGKPSGQTLYDFQNALRSDPRWKQTQNAQDQVMGVASQVLKDMGLVG